MQAVGRKPERAQRAVRKAVKLDLPDKGYLRRVLTDE